jgi:CheY-like chemotaxis protein
MNKIWTGKLLGGEPPSQGANPAAAAGQGTTHWRSLRLLVADDDKDTVNTLKAILEDEGHKVRPVYSGPDVMGAVRGFEPDAVILDIAMPELSGYDVAKQIRTWFVTYRPLLIAISGMYTRGADALLSQEVGFDHHLTKPCNIDELLNLLAPLMKAGRGR